MCRYSTYLANVYFICIVFLAPNENVNEFHFLCICFILMLKTLKSELEMCRKCLIVIKT